jgi:hypothetical protein
MAVDCNKFNDYLFRRTPNWDKELAKDRFPHNYLYTTMYETKTWPSFTGTTHTWDRVHVTRANDPGCWEEMDADACITSICDPQPRYLGWGSTRETYVKYHQDYRTPVFCFDQLRHVQEAEAQLRALVEGLRKQPEEICSDFLRHLTVQQADYIHIAGSGLTKYENANPDTLWTEGCLNLDLGSNTYVPTSKLSMEYLNNHMEDLKYKGYHDREFMENGKFFITTDLQTLQDLSNANPALTQLYRATDFSKTGIYYQYGVAKGVGDWLFKIDPAPLRFNHIGGGKFRRIWPYQNVDTDVGKKPEFSDAYKNAEYQIFHVYNRAAREVHVGDITSVNDTMKFGLARSLMGKWSWKNPDYFKALDINTGDVCEHDNVKKNKGFFLGEYEMGVKSVYPEIEMIILAKREPSGVVNIPRVAGTVYMGGTGTSYQELTPYNTLCETA